MTDLVSTRDFYDLLKQIIKDLFDDVEEFTDYILNEPNLKVDNIESLLRNMLEDVVEIIKKWIQKKYKIKDSFFRNFPSLDNLIYHNEGWTLHNAINKHFQAYNKWRIKENLLNALMSILVTEIQRLPNTIFDEVVRRTHLFEYVTIFGKAGCGTRCSKHYGTYIIDVDDYELPPYHKAFWNGKRLIPACQCKYCYHDSDELDEEDLLELESDDLEEGIE